MSKFHHLILRCSIFLPGLLLASAFICSAQSTGSGDNPVYKRGESLMERVLPAGPQAASVVRMIEEAGVSQSLGAVEVDVPLHTLEGKELCNR